MAREGARHYERDRRLLGKKSQDILMEVEELETFSFGPADVAGIITALTENACD